MNNIYILNAYFGLLWYLPSLAACLVLFPEVDTCLPAPHLGSMSSWEIQLPIDMDIYKVGPPSDVRWFINPRNTIVISTINHSYWSYLHQLSYRLGAPPCSNIVHNCTIGLDMFFIGFCNILDL